MLIDTHAHLWFPEYSQDLDRVLLRAKEAGVEKIIVPGTDPESSRQAVELARIYPGVIYAVVGVHPEESSTLNNQIPNSQILKLINENINVVVAIGEIGTDASTEELKNCMDEQLKLFRAQCELALEHDLPVIIHTRNSLAEALEVLDALPSMPSGQFHCFSHDEEGIKQVLSRGFYVSFCGNITWSKRVAKLVNLVSDDRLLLETDSPLMIPRDKKGKVVQWHKSSDHSVNTKVPNSGPESSEPWESRNQPANVRVLAEKIAELRKTDFESIAKITTENANRLFKL